MSTNQQPINTNNKNNKEEEVDLSSLFVIIGKGFSNFFNFIVTVFRGFFHVLISILIFVKINSVKISIAAIIGLVPGIYFQIKNEKTYVSSLLVQPNFKSASQLYNNVNYYNDLVEQKDTLGLENIFKLDKETAASLKEFKIQPIQNENDIINAYNAFIIDTDTATVSRYGFDQFKESFRFLDYKVHEIRVVSEKNDVFQKLDETILSSVSKNKYFNRVKELSNENINRTDSLLRQNLNQVDAMRKVYMEVMLAEANKQQSAGTNIDLGSGKRATKELDLFKTNRQLNAELTDIVSEKYNAYDVINIISNFQPIGSEIKGFAESPVLHFPILGALLMVFVLVFLNVNNYISNYKK
jgi:hypothetical protein